MAWFSPFPPQFMRRSRVSTASPSRVVPRMWEIRSIMLKPNGDVFASSQAVFFRDSRKQGMLAMGIGARRGILGDRLETGARWYWCA